MCRVVGDFPYRSTGRSSPPLPVLPCGTVPQDKIEIIAKEMYGAAGVEYKPEVGTREGGGRAGGGGGGAWGSIAAGGGVEGRRGV